MTTEMPLAKISIYLNEHRDALINIKNEIILIKAFNERVKQNMQAYEQRIDDIEAKIDSFIVAHAVEMGRIFSMLETHVGKTI